MGSIVERRVFEKFASGALAGVQIIDQNIDFIQRSVGFVIKLGTVQEFAQAALAGNQIDRAERLAREALTSVAALGERQGMVEGLLNLAAVAAARSEIERAATLAGAAAAIRETIAARAADFDVAIAGRLLDRAEASVGKTRWRRGWERGAALDPAAAVALALAR